MNEPYMITQLNHLKRYDIFLKLVDHDIFKKLSYKNLFKKKN